ncbi:type III secretion system HrpP C-terminal domain-containing protein [Pseudomonas sp. NPDC090202]|uniref:type III secretion system HrpP C-terminal domain-containing protein n=1 Tax=unclassified Pseudomonas TaxID=196821 RepID=UPI0037F73449
MTTSRRAEPDRLRSAWPQGDQHDALNADGLFFSQLLITPVSAEPDQSGFGGSGLSLLPPADGVPTQLIDELAERLPDHLEGPLNVTLLMPSLGKVQVNASKRDNQWTVELGFARRGVLKRLQPHQRACQQALTDALGHDVDLSFQEEDAA